MCSSKVGFGLLIAVTLIIGLGIILGGVIPQSLLAKRLSPSTCKVYYTIWDKYCTHRGITSVCYNVLQNIQPLGATCWQAPVIATFSNREDAVSYANSLAPYSLECYTDPNNPCTYYTSIPDVSTMIIVGTVFAAIGVLCCIIAISVSCIAKRCCMRAGYEEVK